MNQSQLSGTKLSMFVRPTCTNYIELSTWDAGRCNIHFLTQKVWLIIPCILEIEDVIEKLGSHPSWFRLKIFQWWYCRAAWLLLVLKNYHAAKNASVDAMAWKLDVIEVLKLGFRQHRVWHTSMSSTTKRSMKEIFKCIFLASLTMPTNQTYKPNSIPEAQESQPQ